MHMQKWHGRRMILSCHFLLGGERVAKGKYENWRTELGQDRISTWCEDGLTDEELAKAMEISPSTLYDWRQKYPEISEAITRGRGGALVLIKNALFERARGGIQLVTKPIKRRVREFDETTGKCIREEEIIEYATEEVYIPPDTNAIKFFLTNRDPEHWTNRVEVKADGAITLEDLADA